jgi:hypothetical protein
MVDAPITPGASIGDGRARHVEVEIVRNRSGWAVKSSWQCVEQNTTSCRRW